MRFAEVAAGTYIGGLNTMFFWELISWLVEK